MKQLKILGLAGSLRKESFNRKVLYAAQKLVPENVILETFDLHGIPEFNQDFEVSPPENVQELKQKIREADAILFVTPEYNYSIPGVLKNAIDWASRPYGESAWEGKPTAIMSASTGMLGGARAQYHLRQVFVFLNMHPVNRPEVMIPFVTDKFDEQGHLIDQHTKDKIQDLLYTLVEWALQLKKGESILAEKKENGTYMYGFKGGQAKKSR